MKIHLSEATNRELESSEFVTEYRGRVPVKVTLKLFDYSSCKFTGSFVYHKRRELITIADLILESKIFIPKIFR